MSELRCLACRRLAPGYCQFGSCKAMPELHEHVYDAWYCRHHIADADADNQDVDAFALELTTGSGG